MLYEDKNSAIWYIRHNAEPVLLYSDAVIVYKISHSVWIIRIDNQLILLFNNKPQLIDETNKLYTLMQTLDLENLCYGMYYKHRNLFVLAFNDKKILFIEYANDKIDVKSIQFNFDIIIKSYISENIMSIEYFYDGDYYQILEYVCDTKEITNKAIICYDNSEGLFRISYPQKIQIKNENKYIQLIDGSCFNRFTEYGEVIIYNFAYPNAVNFISANDGYVVARSNDGITYINNRIATSIPISNRFGTTKSAKKF